MNAKNFVFGLLFILLAGLVLAENQAPTINSVAANPLVIKSGGFVSFEVLASDPDNQPLTFEWDFNDGSTAFGQSVVHAFSIEPGLYHVFNVKVKALDGLGGEAVQTVDVNVTPADFLIKVLSPSLEPQEKGQSLKIKVGLVDPSGEPLPAERVFSVQAMVQDQVIALSPSEPEGTFEGQVFVPFETPASEQLTVEAAATPLHILSSSLTSREIVFAPAELQAELALEPEKVFEGSTLSRLKVSLLYPDGSQVRKALVSGRLGDRELSFTERPYYYEARALNHLVSSESNPVYLYAVDSFGNELFQFSQEIEVSQAETETAMVFDATFLYFAGVALVVIVFLLLIFVGLNFVLRPPKDKGFLEEKTVKPRKAVEDKPASRAKWKVKPGQAREPSSPQKMEKLRALFKETSLKERIAEQEGGKSLSAKEQLALQASSLVDSLRPFKEKFSAEEIMAAAIAQGFDKKTALLIAKKVKGEEK
jgi:hypothetical protein